LAVHHPCITQLESELDLKFENEHVVGPKRLVERKLRPTHAGVG
jgi:hypothetical protein